MHKLFILLLSFFASVNATAGPAPMQAAPLPKYFHSSILCESMLWTRSQHQGAAALNDLIGFKNAFSVQPPLAPKRSTYSSYSLVVSDPRNLTAQQMELFNRISGPLKEDLYLMMEPNPNVQTVMVAYRGQDQVQAAYTEFRAELARGVEHLESRSKQAFAETSKSPKGIFATRLIWIGGFMGALAGLDVIEASTAPGMSAAAISTVYGVEYLLRGFWRGILTSKFKEHLLAVEESLNKQTPIYTAAVSRPLILPTKVHRNFMALGDEDISEETIQRLVRTDSNIYQPLGSKTLERQFRAELTKDGKTSREKFQILADKEMRERLNEPSGVRRLVTMNSYYYWDSKTQEPVWVLTYVARSPGNRGGRKVKKIEAKEKESVWDFGLNPGLSR